MQYLLLIYNNERNWTELPEAEVGALMGDYQSFTQSIAKSGPVYQIDGALLEHARTHALNHVRPAAVFDDDGVNTLLVQQVSDSAFTSA